MKRSELKTKYSGGIKGMGGAIQAAPERSVIAAFVLGLIVGFFPKFFFPVVVVIAVIVIVLWFVSEPDDDAGIYEGGSHQDGQEEK